MAFQATRAALAAALLTILLAGLPFAISGASVSTSSSTRWSGSTPGSADTEGGNLTYANLTSSSLTDKWAAFFGNVSGDIALTNGTSAVYTWTVTAAAGKVCASTGSTVSGNANNTTGTAIDTAWGFTSAADNATSTFTTNNCTMALAQGTVNNTTNVAHMGYSAFTTCALTIGGTAKANYFFCTAVNSTGKSYNNQSANYEIMVPTAYGPGTETYYFFAELS